MDSGCSDHCCVEAGSRPVVPCQDSCGQRIGFCGLLRRTDIACDRWKSASLQKTIWYGYKTLRDVSNAVKCRVTDDESQQRSPAGLVTVPDCVELINMLHHQEVPIELASGQTNYLTPFLRSVGCFWGDLCTPVPGKASKY